MGLTEGQAGIQFNNGGALVVERGRKLSKKGKVAIGRHGLDMGNELSRYGGDGAQLSIVIMPLHLQ